MQFKKISFLLKKIVEHARKSFKNALFLNIWNFHWLNLSDERFKMVQQFAKKNSISSFWTKSKLCSVNRRKKLSLAVIGFLLHFSSGKHKTFEKRHFGSIFLMWGAEHSYCSGYRVYPWVQGILTTVNVFAQGILIKVDV